MASVWIVSWLVHHDDEEVLGVCEDSRSAMAVLAKKGMFPRMNRRLKQVDGVDERSTEKGVVREMELLEDSTFDGIACSEVIGYIREYRPMCHEYVDLCTRQWS